MKNIGLIGCGNIAETYFRAQDYFNNINFIACADKFPEAAKKCAEQYKIKSSRVDEILNDSDVDIILNLTKSINNRHNFCFLTKFHFSSNPQQCLVDLNKDLILYQYCQSP